MALQMNYDLQGDYRVPAAYVRIKKILLEHNPTLAVTLTGGGTKYVAIPHLEIKSARAKNQLDQWIADKFMFAFDHTINKSLVAQAYDYLKTLPEFTGAVDVAD